MRIRQLKHTNNKVQKDYKKIRKIIIEDLDFTDKVELQAFQYFERVNQLLDQIVNELDALDKGKANL